MAVAQNPGVPNDIDESALVLLVVAMNKVPLHKTGVEGAITVVIVTLEAGVPISAALAVLDVDRDELLDSSRAEVRAGTGVVVAMIPVMLDHVDASMLVLIAVADDNALLLKTCSHGVGGTVPVIPEMANFEVYCNTAALCDILQHLKGHCDTTTLCNTV